MTFVLDLLPPTLPLGLPAAQVAPTRFHGLFVTQLNNSSQLLCFAGAHHITIAPVLAASRVDLCFA
jgi:hypothetical protein